MCFFWDLDDTTVQTPQSLPANVAGIQYFAVSRDGTWLVAGSAEHSARIWRLPASKGGTPVVLAGHEGPIHLAEFSFDSHRLALADKRGVVTIWDLTQDDLTNEAFSPSILRTSGKSLWRERMTFTPDSHWLITGSDYSNENDRLQLWPVQTEELIELARRTAERNLGPSEWRQYFPRQPYRRTFPEMPDCEDIPRRRPLVPGPLLGN